MLGRLRGVARARQGELEDRWHWPRRALPRFHLALCLFQVLFQEGCAANAREEDRVGEIEGTGREEGSVAAKR